MVVHIIIIRLSKGTETTITSLFSNMMTILTTHLVHIQNIFILNLVDVAIKIKLHVHVHHCFPYKIYRKICVPSMLAIRIDKHTLQTNKQPQWLH